MNGVDVLTKMIAHVQQSNAEYHQMLLVKKKKNLILSLILLYYKCICIAVIFYIFNIIV